MYLATPWNSRPSENILQKWRYVQTNNSWENSSLVISNERCTKAKAKILDEHTEINFLKYQKE